VKVTIEGRTLELTHPERILWPETGTTKAEMLDYYATVARVMIPHVAGRPLMIWRWPEGVDHRGWDQFECRGRPSWMATYRLEMRKGEIAQTCVVSDAASLLWLANQGAIELHPFLARTDAFERPTTLVFDLDVGEPAGLVECARVALLLRSVLAAVALEAFPKTSGGVGLHVYVPLNTPVTYAETKAFARAVAGLLAREHPDLIVDRVTRALRYGKVFIDWSQNDERKQTIAPYSLRGRAEPMASAPVRWDEIEHAARLGDARHLVLRASDVLRRVASDADPFAPVASLQQRLPSLAQRAS
jgi:bifunctional non-homologous end joining protein LigD